MKLRGFGQNMNKTMQYAHCVQMHWRSNFFDSVQ
jgi:hypothetical protein